MTKIGALEAGGTKMVLAVYDGDGQELERLTIPTEAPEITMPRMTGFFRDHAIDALGVGSFGPLDLNPASPTYGNITSTPKLKWRNYPLLKGLLDGRDIPAAIDTDVNAAVIAEVECGAARGCESAVYITVGTGVGGGATVCGVRPKLTEMAQSTFCISASGRCPIFSRRRCLSRVRICSSKMTESRVKPSSALLQCLRSEALHSCCFSHERHHLPEW